VRRAATTFANHTAFVKAVRLLDGLSLPYEVVAPPPAYGPVAVGALVLDEAARIALFQHDADPFTCAGWVDYVPGDPDAGCGREPQGFENDLFGTAAMMLLAPCMADERKLRIVAQLSGSIEPAFPYMNAEMPQACYNPNGPTFTYMEGRRMISLYARRIAAARVDTILDAWRVLASVRMLVNDAWARRSRISPCFEMRQKPPALEIYKRLPRTNCRQCGEVTCLAFAVRVHLGELPVTQCLPAIDGEHAHRREPLLEICRAWQPERTRK
jgi:ArsR family metal-binding transcriptional regulator